MQRSGRRPGDLPSQVILNAYRITSGKSAADFRDLDRALGLLFPLPPSIQRSAWTRLTGGSARRARREEYGTLRRSWPAIFRTSPEATRRKDIERVPSSPFTTVASWMSALSLTPQPIPAR